MNASLLADTRVRCRNSNAVRIVVALAIASLLGCATGVKRGERVRSGLMELSPRQVVTCLGPPARLDRRGTSEWALYAHPRRQRHGEASFLLRSSPSPHRVEPPEITRGYCAYLFEFSSGRVSDLAVRGRTPGGLNADAECLIELHRCVER